MDKKKEKELKEINKKLDAVNKKRMDSSNELYELNEKRIALLQEKSRENIGRCFIQLIGGKVIAYFKIIDIDSVKYNMSGPRSFNEYQYQAICFMYPYEGEFTPFNKVQFFSAAWGKGYDTLGDLKGITYKEITNEEFMEKFNEVNAAWIEKLKEA
jgi:hypothetical protein